MVSREEVMDVFRNVEDPELAFSIVDLGLVYRVDVQGDRDRGGFHPHLSRVPGGGHHPQGHHRDAAGRVRSRGRDGNNGVVPHVGTRADERRGAGRPWLSHLKGDAMAQSSAGQEPAGIDRATSRSSSGWTSTSTRERSTRSWDPTARARALSRTCSWGTPPTR